MSIDVSLIPDLASAIPDRNLVIDEVFPLEELRAIYERFLPYLEDQLLLPFLGTLGGNTIALGFGEMNAGRVFYCDMDFGLFELSENIEGFIAALQRKTTKTTNVVPKGSNDWWPI
jgi:hypothetical protein